MLPSHTSIYSIPSTIRINSSSEKFLFGIKPSRWIWYFVRIINRVIGFDFALLQNWPFWFCIEVWCLCYLQYMLCSEYVGVSSCLSTLVRTAKDNWFEGFRKENPKVSPLRSWRCVFAILHNNFEFNFNYICLQTFSNFMYCQVRFWTFFVRLKYDFEINFGWIDGDRKTFWTQKLRKWTNMHKVWNTYISYVNMKLL